MRVYTLQQRAHLVLWFAECKNIYDEFVLKVRRLEGDDAAVPDKKTILKWRVAFLETGSVGDKQKTGTK